MTIAFVIGNGLSRQSVDLNLLKSCGVIYGCNALYREFTPDVLVSTDRPISAQIQESGYSRQYRHYTRHPLPQTGALPLIEKYKSFSSGPNAVALSAQDRFDRIYLLGFDMGPTENNTFNNIYAGTEFYKSKDHPPTFTGNWVKQLIQIMGDYPLQAFARVYGPTTAVIPELSVIKNLEHHELTDFLDRINKQKDL